MEMDENKLEIWQEEIVFLQNLAIDKLGADYRKKLIENGFKTNMIDRFFSLKNIPLLKSYLSIKHFLLPETKNIYIKPKPKPKPKPLSVKYSKTKVEEEWHHLIIKLEKKAIKKYGHKYMQKLTTPAIGWATAIFKLGTSISLNKYAELKKTLKNSNLEENNLPPLTFIQDMRKDLYNKFGSNYIYNLLQNTSVPYNELIFFLAVKKEIA